MRNENREELVLGGIYIADSGGKILFDYISEDTTGQTLVSQAFQDTPTLYIPLHPSIKSFMYYGYYIGYVDGANANDLGELYFFDRIAADDWENQMGCFYAITTNIAETPLTAIGTRTMETTPYPVRLEDAGKVYFKTVWDNAVLDCGAGEHFFLILYGRVLESI